VTGAEPKERDALETRGHGLVPVAFAPDGKLLAAPGKDSTVRLWDLTGTKPKEVLHPLPVTSHAVSLCFAPDGKTLATADGGRQVILWNLTSPRGIVPKQKVFPREGQQFPGEVRCVAFAPDGRHLAVGNSNCTIYLLRLAPPPTAAQ
jgi:WD40 repeat protein